jgi:hypothetical protein
MAWAGKTLPLPLNKKLIFKKIQNEGVKRIHLAKNGGPVVCFR